MRMHDSFTPLGGMIPLINIMLGEVVFGGVGAGLYGIMVFIILAVFIAGLMVGRTPEYLGKKIEAFDVKMAMLSILIYPLCLLGFSAFSVVAPFGTSSLANPGPHGLSRDSLCLRLELGANNGSAFAGLNANTLWYNITHRHRRCCSAASSWSSRSWRSPETWRGKNLPESVGHVPGDDAAFPCLLIAMILIVSALTFFPALSLGPILEHLLMHAGKVF